MTSRREQTRSLLLAVLMVTSMVAGSAAFAGTATAQPTAVLEASDSGQQLEESQQIAERESVRLQAGNSTGPDATQLTYNFTQIRGPSAQLLTELSPPDEATVILPEVREPKTVAFQVEVSDGSSTDSDTFNLTVTPTAERYLNLSQPQAEYVVGSDVVLQGSVSQEFDEAALYVQSNENQYELVELDGRSTFYLSGPNLENSPLISDPVRLAGGRQASGNALLVRYGVYDLAILNATKISRDYGPIGDDPLPSSYVENNTDRTTATIEVVPPRLNTSIEPADGRVSTSQNAINISGYAPPSDEVLFIAIDSTGQVRPLVVNVRDSGRYDEESIALFTRNSTFARGPVSIHILSAGRDGVIGNGTLPNGDLAEYNQFGDYLDTLSGDRDADALRQLIYDETIQDDAPPESSLNLSQTESDDLLVNQSIEIVETENDEPASDPVDDGNAPTYPLEFVPIDARAGNQPYAFGVPGPTDQTLAEFFGDDPTAAQPAAAGDGVVYTLTAGGWMQVTGTNEVHGLHGYVLSDTDQPVQATAAIAQAENGLAQPTQRELTAGTNFVTPTAQGAIQDELTFQLSDGEATQVQNPFAEPTMSPGTETLFSSAAVAVGGEQVNPFAGYFLISDSGQYTSTINTGDNQDAANNGLNLEAAPAPATFEVTNVSPQDDNVTEGDPLPVEITVENRGEVADTQGVALRVNTDDLQDDYGLNSTSQFESVNSTQLTLDTGSRETVTLTYASAIGDAPEIDVIGGTEDDLAIERATLDAAPGPQFVSATVEDSSPSEIVVSFDENVTGDAGDAADFFTFDPDETLTNSPRVAVGGNLTAEDGDIIVPLDDAIDASDNDTLTNALFYDDTSDTVVAQSDATPAEPFNNESVTNTVQAQSSSGSISGTVTDTSTTQGINGADVAIFEDESGDGTYNTSVANLTTNANGTYSTVVDPGAYLVEATAQDYESSGERMVTVNSGEERTVDFNLTASETSDPTADIEIDHNPGSSTFSTSVEGEYDNAFADQLDIFVRTDEPVMFGGDADKQLRVVDPETGDAVTYTPADDARTVPLDEIYRLGFQNEGTGEPQDKISVFPDSDSELGFEDIDATVEGETGIYTDDTFSEYVIELVDGNGTVIDRTDPRLVGMGYEATFEQNGTTATVTRDPAVDANWTAEFRLYGDNSSIPPSEQILDSTIVEHADGDAEFEVSTSDLDVEPGEYNWDLVIVDESRAELDRERIIRVFGDSGFTIPENDTANTTSIQHASASTARGGGDSQF